MKLMMKVFLCPEQSLNSKTEWIELNRYFRKLNTKLLCIDNKAVVFFYNNSPCHAKKLNKALF